MKFSDPELQQTNTDIIASQNDPENLCKPKLTTLAICFLALPLTFNFGWVVALRVWSWTFVNLYAHDVSWLGNFTAYYWASVAFVIVLLSAGISPLIVQELVARFRQKWSDYDRRAT